MKLYQNSLNAFIILTTSLFINVLSAQDDFSDESQNNNMNISGVITNAETGKPVLANIVVVSTDLGTASDEDGNFSIKTEVGSELSVSAIGYETQSICR